MPPIARRRVLLSAPACALASASGPAEGRPPDVGGKFNEDGSVRRFTGNTIICPLPQTSAAFAAMVELREMLAKTSLAERMTLLPPASYHMTICNGLDDEHRAPPFWPDDLARDTPMEVCNQHLLEALEGFHTLVPLPIRMRAENIVSHSGGIVLRLRPDSRAQEASLRALRRLLADRLRLPFELPDRYQFHMTLSYFYRTPAAGDIGALRPKFDQAVLGFARDAPVVEFGAPKFCVFENMFAFHPRRVLASP